MNFEDPDYISALQVFSEIHLNLEDFYLRWKQWFVPENIYVTNPSFATASALDASFKRSLTKFNSRVEEIRHLFSEMHNQHKKFQELQYAKEVLENFQKELDGVLRKLHQVPSSVWSCLLVDREGFSSIEAAKVSELFNEIPKPPELCLKSESSQSPSVCLAKDSN